MEVQTPPLRPCFFSRLSERSVMKKSILNTLKKILCTPLCHGNCSALIRLCFFQNLQVMKWTSPLSSGVVVLSKW